jgi:hypothetical protein
VIVCFVTRLFLEKWVLSAMAEKILLSNFLFNKQIRKEHHISMKDMSQATQVHSQSSDALSRASAVIDSVLN